MLRQMMKSKIHRATVTEANLNYIGSVTIDQDLLELVDILPDERVQIVNNNNGARLETYAIPGPRGSGVICLNGAAARLVQTGDTVIIIGYGFFADEEARRHTPKVAIMNEKNQVVQLLEREPHSTVLQGV
jgi:aspartate 1-decarboxylase